MLVIPANDRERAIAPTAKTPSIPPLSNADLATLPARLPAWAVKSVDGIDRLERAFGFPNFRAGVDFTNRLGELAETSNHHPAILTEVDQVTVNWWTFTTGGITHFDVTMAEKTDRLYESMTASEAK